jgi:hypothetical protein
MIAENLSRLHEQRGISTLKELFPCPESVFSSSFGLYLNASMQSCLVKEYALEVGRHKESRTAQTKLSY